MKSDGSMSSEAIFLAIGANLPGRDGRSALATCLAAAEALRFLPGLRMTGQSRWFRTAPIPPGGPDYVNGVVRLLGPADPAWLLARLQAIETQAGRVRSTANAPRTLDLDIIAMGSLVRDRPDPVLPHPRAHLRAFVLAPLCDIDSQWRHPRLGQTAAALLASLPVQDADPL
jgi:2-amino-4-hydroxy-6-hydroxymethyldihydropteridine diphosphokinase